MFLFLSFYTLNQNTGYFVKFGINSECHLKPLLKREGLYVKKTFKAGVRRKSFFPDALQSLRDVHFLKKYHLHSKRKNAYTYDSNLSQYR